MEMEIAHLTLNSLMIVAAMFALGVVVLVLCTGLRINPFREKTTSFLLAVFGGLIGLASILVLLNVATNISIIADARTAGANAIPQANVLLKWFPVFFGTALALVGILFAGTNLSRKKYLQIVRAQADDVLKQNEELIKEISRLLASGESNDYKRVGEIRAFLANQRKDLPVLTIIYCGEFADRSAFYKIDGFFPEVPDKVYKPEYFACTQNLDCDYLNMFFSGTKVDVLQKSTDTNSFFIYIPVASEESRYVLLFERRNHYGKFGS
jgi:hypothetical protein